MLSEACKVSARRTQCQTPTT